MNDGFQFIDIIFFALVAGFLVLRLRSVLGRRTGTERQDRPDYFGTPRRNDNDGAADNDAGNVVPMPARRGENPALDAEVEAMAASISPKGAGLTQIKLADPAFTADGFLKGAKAAFEIILGAFAQGDAATLKPLLSPDVFTNFKAAMDERQAQGETLDAELVGFVSAEIAQAQMDGRIARVTVRFVTEQVNVLRDAGGEVLEGDPNRVTKVTDIWTFTRDTRSKNPNWLLVATATPDDATTPDAKDA